MRNGVLFIVISFSSYYGILFFQIFFKSFIYDDGYHDVVTRLFMHGCDGLRYSANSNSHHLTRSLLVTYHRTDGRNAVRSSASCINRIHSSCNRQDTPSVSSPITTREAHRCATNHAASLSVTLNPLYSTMKTLQRSYRLL